MSQEQFSKYVPSSCHVMANPPLPGPTGRYIVPPLRPDGSGSQRPPHLADRRSVWGPLARPLDRPKMPDTRRACAVSVGPGRRDEGGASPMPVPRPQPPTAPGIPLTPPGSSGALATLTPPWPTSPTTTPGTFSANLSPIGGKSSHRPSLMCARAHTTRVALASSSVPSGPRSASHWSSNSASVLARSRGATSCSLIHAVRSPTKQPPSKYLQPTRIFARLVAAGRTWVLQPI